MPSCWTNPTEAPPPTWYRSVRVLLEKNPEARLIGLTATPIRFLDRQLDTCELLFDSCVASQLTLGEAIVRGILGASTYVTALYYFAKQLERYERRIRFARRRAARDRGEELLEALRRAIDQAEGLDEIFARHMKDRTGKYLVFCSSFEHMREMAGLAREHFGRIISAQRERYRGNRMGDDEIQALEAIGMKWRGEYHRERASQP